MKIFSVILAFTFVLSLSVSAQNDLPKIKPEKTYKQTGVKFVSPNQADWQLVKSENLETSFSKNDADTKYSASVKTATTDAFENAEDLFLYLEKSKQEEIKNLDRDSLHFNRTNFRDTPCLQYDGIFKNSAGENDSSYTYFNLYGFLCRHPSAQNTIIQFEFSNYSNVRGFTETENKLSREFFEKIQFVKVKK